MHFLKIIDNDDNIFEFKTLKKCDNVSRHRANVFSEALKWLNHIAITVKEDNEADATDFDCSSNDGNEIYKEGTGWCRGFVAKWVHIRMMKRNDDEVVNINKCC